MKQSPHWWGEGFQLGNAFEYVGKVLKVNS